MRNAIRLTLATALSALLFTGVDAQTLPVEDAVIRRIWQLGMEQSQAMALAQVLMDSVGPRLTGSPGQKSAHDWAVKTYASWGISAKNEQYGTWTGWRRGFAHIDLVAPRQRSLWGMPIAWSAPTNGPVEGPVVALPVVANLAAFEAWLPSAKGAFVVVAPAPLSCRPDGDYQEFGTPGAVERRQQEQQAAVTAFNQQRIQSTGLSANQMRTRLEDVGALGIVQSGDRGNGVQAIFSTPLRKIPVLDLACEDYGLVSRLAEKKQGPRLRVDVQSQFNPDVPTFNTIAEIKGSEKPNEYVMLSAHFDSWDGGSGATDNGTGTIVMMEAMRILKQVYPNPKRTIIAGHWSGEEQGLNGSHAWVTDHPEVVSGLHALFNQDNGTGRVVNLGLQGLPGAGPFFGKWLNRIPTEISTHIKLNIPGTPSSGGTDNASFICAGAPAFGLGSISWNYNPYTHHTQVDTYDKIVAEEFRNNATLTAMLVYLASEEAERIPRDKRVMPSAPGGGAGSWPQCRDGARRPPVTTNTNN